MKNKYQMNKGYITPSYILEVILEHLKNLHLNTILYIGYADKNMCQAIHKKYDLTTFDWFDKTHTSVHYWEEDEEFLAKYPIPDWVTDDMTFASGVGFPRHEVLLLEIPIDFDLEEGLGKRKSLPRATCKFNS